MHNPFAVAASAPRALTSPALWLVLVALAVVGVAVGPRLYSAVAGPRGEGPPLLAALPEFRLTDQAGRPFGPAEMRGKTWVANFIFVGCSEVCPRLTGRMKLLQERLAVMGARAEGVHLLSISVDPENDTPERLAAYAEAFGADTRTWAFVTGPADEVERTVVQGFKIGVGKEPVLLADGKTEVLQIFHGEHFVLVDPDGRIRGYYTSDDDGLARLERDLAALRRSR
jgi:protein SCO1